VRPKSVLTTAAIALAVVVAYNHVQANGVPKPGGGARVGN
jgi:hypothetical protein